MDQADVEREISDGIAQQAGFAPDAVDCPDDLEADLDATMECTVTLEEGLELPVLVSVTEIDGDEVYFEFDVVDEPAS